MERRERCFILFILNFQDLLELAETIGPARPQGLPQEGMDNCSDMLHLAMHVYTLSAGTIVCDIVQQKNLARFVFFGDLVRLQIIAKLTHQVFPLYCIELSSTTRIIACLQPMIEDAMFLDGIKSTDSY